MLGDPVRHSLSPRIQNAAFRSASLEAVYVAFEVPGPRLADALRGLHAARVEGLNLTTPHKEAAFSLVLERTSEAGEARAVNTLRWSVEGWQGHATDGLGFLAWVEEACVSLEGKRVLLLGAGGAARSIVPKLLGLRPREVIVVSRTLERAEALAREAAAQAPGWPPLEPAALYDRTKTAARRRWDLMLRALSTGEISDDEERWWRGLVPEAPILDLNYTERAEAPRARARAEGRRFLDGLGLLIHQGAASFEFWTGRKPSLAAMRAAVKR